MKMACAISIRARKLLRLKTNFEPYNEDNFILVEKENHRDFHS